MALLLHRAGVALLVGTDSSSPGVAMYRELEFYVEAGIPAADVLCMATLGSARAMNRDREVGIIAAGKLGA